MRFYENLTIYLYVWTCFVSLYYKLAVCSILFKFFKIDNQIKSVKLYQVCYNIGKGINYMYNNTL